MTSTTNVLETLYAARDRLTGDAPFRFTDWASCTCGHIYAAANDGQAAPKTDNYVVNGYREVKLDANGQWLRDPDGTYHRDTPQTPPAYRDAIIAAARALGWDGTHVDAWTDWGRAATYVSNMTVALADNGYPDEVKRDHAVEVLDEAIATIEQQQEQDRQRVLAEAEAARTRAGLPGPSRTITVEPLELPNPEPTPLPEKAPAEPAPERTPVEPEKVPA